MVVGSVTPNLNIRIMYIMSDFCQRHEHHFLSLLHRRIDSYQTVHKVIADTHGGTKHNRRHSVNEQPKPLWRPHTAGLLLGLGLLLTFLLTGHGLGGSGFTTALAAKSAKTVLPTATEANAYLGPMVEDGNNPLNAWITWQVLGVAVGALVGAVTARRFKWTVDGPTRMTKAGRLVLALAGGMVAGLGARISLGCTSGLGLSGAATLATAGFLFLIGFFAAGALLGLLTRKLWS